MSEPSCIQCGQPGGTQRLNHLPNGLPCPICRDRLLESIPAPFGGLLAEDESDDAEHSFEPRFLAGGGEWSPEGDEDDDSPA